MSPNVSGQNNSFVHCSFFRIFLDIENLCFVRLAIASLSIWRSAPSPSCSKGYALNYTKFSNLFKFEGGISPSVHSHLTFLERDDFFDLWFGTLHLMLDFCVCVGISFSEWASSLSFYSSPGSASGLLDASSSLNVSRGCLDI